MDNITNEMSVNHNVSHSLMSSNESGCTYFGGDQHKCDVILIMKRVMASFSLIGCLFMIFIIWLFRKYIIFTQRLILYLTIAALCNSIGLLMQEKTFEDGAWCSFQAWFVTLFDWSVLMWVWCITFNLFMLAIKNKRLENKEWLFHVICWGVPFGISLIPFIGNHYGPSGMWCWIINDWIWRFLIWYIPLFFGIAGLFVTYTYIIVALRKKLNAWDGMYDPDNERRKKMLEEDIKPLRGYPFVYLAVSLFSFINRIQNSISPEPIFALVLLHAMTSPLQGFLNAIVYGLDKDTMSKLTPSQMKVALRSRRTHSVIREYPVHVDDALDGEYLSQEITSVPNYNHISYSRLV